MYLTSGHLPYYQDSMFPPMELDGTKYYLKAMNCPHHHKIFDAEPKSYKDMPLRLAEYGTCYRYEQSGELFGLMRVRCLHMNDAHIYCTKEQFAQEFKAVNDMYLKYFKIFGIDKYVMRLSLHDPAKLGQKYINEPELWLQTEAMVREVLAEESAPSKKTAAEEITAKAVNAIDDHNEGEGKGYKKKWLEDVFDSYEDKVGHRYGNEVFQDVIAGLKDKGYLMKETFDGRDNLIDPIAAIEK